MSVCRLMLVVIINDICNAKPNPNSRVSITVRISLLTYTNKWTYRLYTQECSFSGKRVAKQWAIMMFFTVNLILVFTNRKRISVTCAQSTNIWMTVIMQVWMTRWKSISKTRAEVKVKGTGKKRPRDQYVMFWSSTGTTDATFDILTSVLQQKTVYIQHNRYDSMIFCVCTSSLERKSTLHSCTLMYT